MQVVQKSASRQIHEIAKCLNRENKHVFFFLIHPFPWHYKYHANTSKQIAKRVAHMVTGSIGKLHSWSKDVDTTGGMAVMWDEKRKEFNTDPNAVLDERTHGWEAIW